jgi:hypothetical protein
MTRTELIEKLGTFPPNDIAGFYCPVDKTYYYVYSIDIAIGRIALTQSRAAGIDYGKCISLLKRTWRDVEIYFKYGGYNLIAL